MTDLIHRTPLLNENSSKVDVDDTITWYRQFKWGYNRNLKDIISTYTKAIQSYTPQSPGNPRLVGRVNHLKRLVEYLRSIDK